MILINNIRCEYIENPISITTMRPRFSWEIVSEENNIYQKAYEIQVENEVGDIIWNSGRVESSNSVEVYYNGEVLDSCNRYYYYIKVWDQNENLIISDKAYFETAFLNTACWKAKWIEPEPLKQLEENPLSIAQNHFMNFVTAMMKGENPEYISDDELLQSLPLEPYDPAVRMRRTFSIDKKIKKARVYMTTHGIYEVKINGKKVDDSILAPGFTTYDKRIKYQVYNVDSLINNGLNAVGVTIADGWYKGKIALGRGCEYGEVLGLLFQLELTYEDNSKDTICSDELWKYSYDGPVRLADLFLGETIDSRMDDGEISSVEYDDSEWKAVYLKGDADDTLEAQIDPPVRVFNRIEAKRIWTAPNGDTLVDFGQNLAGFLNVKLTCKEGEKITFEHGEVLDKDGNFTYAFTGPRSQKDTYICRGNGLEVFEPKFTYHGFRYVRVTGGSNWEKEQFTALAISTDNNVTGSFRCSDDKLNQLQHNIYWSQLSNNITIPTDCPTREKAGWTGDVVVYGPTALYNQDMVAFYEDWLRSIRVEQLDNGHVLNTVPQIKNYVQQSMAGSLGWGDVIITLPWQLYKLSGDRKALEENYEAMGKWMTAMKNSAYEMPHNINSESSERHIDNQHYLINTGFHFGDWLVPSVKNEQGFSDGPASSFLTMNYVGTSLLVANAELYSKISKILGYEKVSEEYKKYAKRVREAFYEEYVDENGRLGQELQGNYILALVNHMLPKEKEELLANRLNDLIKENGECLDTGFMSVAYLLDVLCDYGYEDTAWKVLWQNKCPSWIYEIEKGATTLWENWDAIREDGSVDKCSFNHYAFGCVGDFLYRRILGLQNVGLGYDEILINPIYTCGLEWVEGSYNSVHGEISIRWEKKDEGYLVSGKVPANTKATIVLPNGDKKEIGNGKFNLMIK